MAAVSPTAGFASSVTQTNHPLVARYSLNAPANSTVTIEFGLTTSYGPSTWEVAAPAGGGLVSILVAGMQAGSTYHMRALVTVDGVTTPDVDYEFVTGMLPLANLPRLDVTSPGQPCPGVELVNVNPKSVCVSDLQGNIIWYYLNRTDVEQHGHPMPLKPLPNGNLMAMVTNRYRMRGLPSKVPYGVLREFDLAGETVSNQFGPREIDLAELNRRLQGITTRSGRTVRADYFSHDFLYLPNGHVIVICQEQLFAPELGGIWGDILIDLDESFNPVWVWSIFDVLHLSRHPFEWNPNHDWTHCNSIEATPDGNLLLSVRNQSWVFKIDYANGSGSGKVLWRLGYEGDFTLTHGAPANWFYCQHFAHVLDSSGGNITSLALVDNGNYRVGSKASPYSRGVILALDEVNKTCDVTWSYPQPPSFFSFWGGNVVRLPNGNVEICMSDPWPDGKPPQSFAAEVTEDQQAVWQMDITPADAYRCYRIPSLYPGVQW